MQRRVKVSRELQTAIDQQNEANRIAKVESKKPRHVLRAEANSVRRELKHMAMLTYGRQRVIDRQQQQLFRQAREAIAARKRIAEITKGLPAEEKKTETGIVLPSGKQVGKVLAGASAKTV